MAESIVTFQSQLSGVMETVFKAAMYEITRLVEDSFLEELTRCREQVEALKRRLKWVEGRGKAGISGGLKGTTTEKGLKQEFVLPEELPDSEEAKADDQNITRTPQASCEQGNKLDRLLKKESLPQSDPEAWSLCADESVGSSLPGPSKRFGPQRPPKTQESWETGFGQKEPDPGDPSEPLFQPRYELGYGDPGVMEVGGDLGYGEPYEEEEEVSGNRGSPSKTTDTGAEFGCMLINEEGFLQDPNASYADQVSGNRSSFRGPCVQFDPCLEALDLGESLQHPAALRGEKNYNKPDSGHLKTHKETQKEAQYSCNQCGKTFSQACNLRVHQRVHSSQGVHPCGLCGKGFPSPADLRTHRCGQQAGEKPYCCAVCGNRFSRLWNLKLHRRIHTQEKPHRCGMCEKSFTRADILKVHQRTHTGERPYRCPVCGLSFKRLDHLKSHQRKHTADL